MIVSAELREYIKRERDRIVRSGIKFDSVGRRILFGTLEQAEDKVQRDRERKRANNRRFERKKVLERMAIMNLIFNDEEENKVRCTLCDKVSSKYNNQWAQHFPSCKHYVQKPENLFETSSD